MPTLLVKVTQHVYEVMDDNDDICFASLQLEGKGSEGLVGGIHEIPYQRIPQTLQTFYSATAQNIDWMALNMKLVLVVLRPIDRQQK